jgi:hypothetical protein
MPDNSWRRIAFVILSIGSLFVLGGILLGQGSLRLVVQGAQAEGEVIGIRPDGQMYEPVVRFRLPDGTWHEVKDLGTGAPDFAVGDRVTVLYWPDDPDSFRLDTFERLWFNALFVICFGAFWLLFGLVAWGLSRGIDLAVLGEGLFATIAGAALVIGIVATWTTAGLYAGGVRTEGEVIDIRVSRYTEREEIDGDRRRTRTVERVSYVPVVRFATQDGRTIEFHGRGGSETAHAEGDRVPLVYDPARPINAHILSFLDLWLPASVAWGVAAIFGGVVWLSRWTRLKGLQTRSSS